MRDIFIGLEGNKSVVYEIKVQVQQVSMRKGTLKVFGGDLHNLYNSPRFESGFLSRDSSSGKACRKDWHCSRKRFDRKGMTRELTKLRNLEVEELKS